MSLKDLPSVDRLLSSPGGAKLITSFGRPLTLQALREVLNETRAAVKQGARLPAAEALLVATQTKADTWLQPSLHSVVNATGVIIHTNLGRAPLSQAAQAALLEIAAEFSTLEYQLARGVRGKREQHVEHLLTRLTGAEAALVVNNNAAAVLLTLTSLAKRKEVILSRSQLIEIGGGFRIPDVMRQSGAKLREVGTTNRTHLHDYEDAIQPRTALILHAHHSNFKIVGFTTEPSLEELVQLGVRHDLPVVEDLGSGALLDTAAFGLQHEPMVQEALQCGASLIAFSGDKLLGGPQAGILVGERGLMDRLRKHPLARAIRPDKLCLAALAATLTHYLKDEAIEHIPVWRMISMRAEDLRTRAHAWRELVGQGEVIPGFSTVGGGSLPGETLPTWLLALDVPRPTAFARRLRNTRPAVVARIEDERVLLDPRTVLPHQEDLLLAALEQVIKT